MGSVIRRMLIHRVEDKEYRFLSLKKNRYLVD